MISISYIPLPVLRSHIIPSPPRSPVKINDPSGCKLKVWIYLLCPFWLLIYFIRLESQILQLLSYEAVRNIVVDWWNLILLILSECPFIFIDFCDFKLGSNVHTYISPVFELVIMLGAKAGILLILGWRSTSHSLSIPFSSHISFPKSIDF